MGGSALQAPGAPEGLGLAAGRVALLEQRVALRVHGAPPNWWTPAVENAARQLARRVDAAEAAAAASRAAGALAAEETRRERRCGGAVALAAQKAAERASQLFAAAATGDEAALVQAVRDGAAAIAASDAEVTLFGGAQCGTVERRETSLQIPADRGPLGLVTTGALDAAGRAELGAWCLLTGRALEQARALRAAAKALGEASANAARAVRAADAKALEAVDGARRAGGVLDAVAAGGDVEELVAAALDDGGADEIRARVVVPTAGEGSTAVRDGDVPVRGEGAGREELVEGHAERRDPRVAGQRRARALFHEVEEGLRVAGPPERVRQRRADLRVVDEEPVALLDEGARLVDGHLGQHVAVVVAPVSYTHLTLPTILLV